MRSRVAATSHCSRKDMTSDLRLIEDFIPIRKISLEAAREKSVRKGQISTLHLWWARRPLVAARATVWGCKTPNPTKTKLWWGMPRRLSK